MSPIQTPPQKKATTVSKTRPEVTTKKPTKTLDKGVGIKKAKKNETLGDLKKTSRKPTVINRTGVEEIPLNLNPTVQLDRMVQKMRLTDPKRQLPAILVKLSGSLMEPL